MKRFAIIVLVLLSACGAAMAAVYVDPGSPGPLHNGRSWKTAYLTISGALAKTRSGDVWIKAGVYRETITLGKYQNLYGGFVGSERTPAERVLGLASTVIDAENRGRAVDVPNGARCILDGLVIRNGSADRGAGVRCATNSTVAIRRCRIEDCFAQQGGAIYFGTYAMGEVSDCWIAGNGAGLGGGLVVEYHSYPVIRRSVIAWNAATINGGGVYCPYHSGARLENCTLAFNTAQVSGGAVYAYQGGPVTLIASILAFNAAPAGGGVFGGGSTSATTLSRCCFYANQGGDWGGAIRTPPASGRNIFADPMFVDAANGDFGLAPGSACVGIGARL